MNRFPHRFHVLVLTILVVLTTATARAQDSMERWQNFDFAKSALKSVDVASVPLEDLTLMRGIVFGRHGRVFKDATIKTYLAAQAEF